MQVAKLMGIKAKLKRDELNAHCLTCVKDMGKYIISCFFCLPCLWHLLSFPCNSRTVMILNLSSAWVHKQQMSSMSCYIFYNKEENSVSLQRCFMPKSLLLPPWQRRLCFGSVGLSICLSVWLFVLFVCFTEGSWVVQWRTDYILEVI